MNDFFLWISKSKNIDIMTVREERSNLINNERF